MGEAWAPHAMCELASRSLLQHLHVPLATGVLARVRSTSFNIFGALYIRSTVLNKKWKEQGGT
jgi:hypothetical protein